MAKTSKLYLDQKALAEARKIRTDSGYILTIKGDMSGDKVSQTPLIVLEGDDKNALTIYAIAHGHHKEISDYVRGIYLDRLGIIPFFKKKLTHAEIKSAVEANSRLSSNVGFLLTIDDTRVHLFGCSSDPSRGSGGLLCLDEYLELVSAPRFPFGQSHFLRTRDHYMEFFHFMNNKCFLEGNLKRLGFAPSRKIPSDFKKPFLM